MKYLRAHLPGKIFNGEIADSQCALNVLSLSQSHKEMMRMKPEIKNGRRRHALFGDTNAADHTKAEVYKHAQVLAVEWARQKVKLVGTLDPKTSVVAVEQG